MKNATQNSMLEKQADKLWQTYNSNNQQSFWEAYENLLKNTNKALYLSQPTTMPRVKIGIAAHFVLLKILLGIFLLGLALASFWAIGLSPQIYLNQTLIIGIFWGVVCLWLAIQSLYALLIKIDEKGIIITTHLLRERHHYAWHYIQKIELQRSPNVNPMLVVYTKDNWTNKYNGKLSTEQLQQLYEALKTTSVPIYVK